MTAVMAMRSLRVVFFGTSEFAVPILEKLAESPFRPALVVSTPDAPAGRGMRLIPPAVKLAAERLGIPVIQPDRLSPIPHLLSVPADLFIVAAYGKILPSELLTISRRGSLNVHPSLLPRWRGAAPMQQAIVCGDAETGVTIMVMDEQVDHGPVLKNSKLEIRNLRVTTPELTERLATMGAQLLLEVIPEWLTGEIQPQPQDESQATYAKMLRKEDGRIVWSKSAEEIERMVRAFTPWPGSFTFWQRGADQIRLQVLAAAVLPGAGVLAHSTVPGRAAELDGRLVVATGAGTLALLRLKPEGKRDMTGTEFLRGNQEIIGSVLG